jgi:hypothetical protein
VDVHGFEPQRFGKMGLFHVFFTDWQKITIFVSSKFGKIPLWKP